MKDLLEYAGVRAAEAGFSALPEGAARRVGRGLGRLAAAPLRVRRGVVRRQVTAALPGRSPAEVAAIVRGCYEHFGGEIALLARYGRLSRGWLLERTAGVDEARRVARDALGEGRGPLVVTGHLGNWELGGAVLSAALGVPLAAVVKRQRNPRVDRRLAALRRGLGIEPIHREEAARRIPAALGAGEAVALVADQDARHRGVFVPFLGRPASTFRGPARLALARDVPLLFGALVREGEGYRLHLERVPRPGRDHEPPDGRRGPAREPADGEAAERELTRRWVARLEGAIRARPEQYFWFHRRWKTRPPENDAGGVGYTPRRDSA